MTKPDTPERARELGRMFQTTVLPVEAPDHVSARRERLVTTIGDRIERTAHGNAARQRAKLFGWALASAACVGLAIGAAHAGWTLPSRGEPHATAGAHGQDAIGAHVRARSGDVSLFRDRHSMRVMTARTELLAGDRIVTAKAATAALGVANTVSIDILEDSDVSLVARDTRPYRLHVARGHLEARVTPEANHAPKLVVETPAADVVVTGTAFTVTVAPRDGVHETLVAVSDGRVVIRRLGVDVATVSAGETWSSASKAAGSAGEAAETEPVTADRTVATVAEAAHPPRTARAPKPAPIDTLAEQNQLFRAALDARNQGDDARALSALTRLLSQHPRSPLAHEARVEKMRALRRLSRLAEASAEAARYLAEYPSGFARQEAEALVLERE